MSHLCVIFGTTYIIRSQIYSLYEDVRAWCEISFGETKIASPNLRRWYTDYELRGMIGAPLNGHGQHEIDIMLSLMPYDIQYYFRDKIDATWFDMRWR